MGFPTRVGRNGFGPDPINARPVRDPRKQLDGETIGRLMFWQLGGLGIASPQAWYTAGAGSVLSAHGEAFQPRGGPPPTLHRNEAGVWTFLYAETYQDETGALVPLQFSGCAAFPHGETAVHAQGQVAPYFGLIRFRALTTGVLTDPDSVLVVLW